MKGRKQTLSEPTRRQPQRAARDTRNPNRAGAQGVNGIEKHEGKSRGLAARQRKKLQQTLIKKTDARDSGDAWAEQAHLLGLNDALPPSSPMNARASDSKVQGRRKPRGKKYMDDMLNLKDLVEDELNRGQRWIPDFAHRKRPNYQPPGVPLSLWMSYVHLDDYIYRHSLSREEIESLPLLDDVHEYQYSDGRKPRPITPLGYQWDKNLELIPVGNEVL
ncbi:hypothetical protein F5Y09DRAFT_344905 [Xylaria sp. FL1042]|nr:hypothetical protein F5Y09DRAFT_344905 [Xylaria sp. FL1042]